MSPCPRVPCSGVSSALLPSASSAFGVASRETLGCQGEEVTSLCCRQEGRVTRLRTVSQKDWVYLFFLILKTPRDTSVCTKNLRCEKPRCRGAAVKLRNVPCLGCQGEVFGRVLMRGRCSPCRWCRAEGLIWHLDRGSGGKALRQQGWLFSQRLFHSGGVLSCHCKGSSENV